MGEELKPCPFCGGKAHVRQGTRELSWMWFIDCEHRCPFDFMGSSKEKVIASWNRREGDAS